MPAPHRPAWAATLANLARQHLVAKAESENFTEDRLAATEKWLARAVEALDAVAVRAAWKPGVIRSKMFRPYCAARLQTLDQGNSHRVSPKRGSSSTPNPSAMRLRNA